MLERFEKAQAGVYDLALAEVKAGRKRSHWMWYVFPQVAGLGHSSTSRFYGITGIGEARDYLAHPVLGSRLRQIAQALMELETDDAHAVFGSPDDLKLRSSMTLFDLVEPGSVFASVLDKYYGGRRDNRTLSLLKDQFIR